jgi:predicted phosphate transport protein (TIGR00153 family)
MVRLVPRDEDFVDLINQDADNLLLAARALDAMFLTYDRLDDRVAEIQRLEKRGDEIDREIQARLERAFITPFDREDIHELAARLDDVVDGIQSVAETMIIYGVDAPTDEARDLAAILTDQAEHLVAAVRTFDRFKGIEPHLREIHELEHRADGLSREAIGGLFRPGDDPLRVIKWMDIYKELEETIDAAEDTGEIIERIVAKSS